MLKYLYCRLVWLVVVVLVAFQTNPLKAYSLDNSFDNMSEQSINKRISKLNSKLDLVYNNDSRAVMKRYLSGNKSSASLIIGKSKLYFPIFEKLLKAYHLPNELKYLAIVESELIPTARSRAGASGLWQFMSATAYTYGLRMNSTVDERLDPYRSTIAAVKYLKDLHNEFGDWTLAIAAYNCGPNYIKRAISQSGSKNYWKLRRYLPRETQKYVPKFVAFSYLMNYYDEHGIVPAEMPQEFLKTSTVKVMDSRINLKDFANKLSLDFKYLKLMNASYKSNILPATKKGHYLTIPVEEVARLEKFNIKYDNIADEILNLSRSLHYKNHNKIYSLLLSRESISVVANLVNNKDNWCEQSDILLEELESSLSLQTISTEKIEYYEYYRLGIRETIMDIAAIRSDINLDDLIDLNHIDVNNPPKPGSMIKLKLLK